MSEYSIRQVFVVQAERLSGVDTLHINFDKSAAIMAGNNLIKCECKDLRNNSTYNLVTVQCVAYSFDTAKSAYDRMLLKKEMADSVIDTMELTFLMDSEIVPCDEGYVLTNKKFKKLITMRAPYPVGGDSESCVLSVMEQVRADMARISYILSKQNVKLPLRERKYLSSHIAEYYEKRDNSGLTNSDPGVYQKIVDAAAEKRVDIVRRYLANDPELGGKSFMDLTSSIYLPFLNELMENFEQLIPGRTPHEANELIALMEYFQDYKKGKPFAGYELLPRSVRI